MKLLAALAAAIGCAAAQPQPSFTLGQVLSAAFPSELTAAPAGGKVAWVSNAKGVRNILVAAPPDYRARTITAYTTDDGQELSGLNWTPDAAAIVYVRGDGANPADNPHGAAATVWIAPLDGTPPRKLGEGTAPAVSPSGDRAAWLHAGQIWWAGLDGKTAASRAFVSRGECGRPLWSPDGKQIAFTSGRGDHGLIGLYDAAADSLRYLDPSTDFDLYPAWSPDGRSIAFVRIPSNGLRPVREARRTAEPWSIRIASLETGKGREVWRAREGPGSVFREVSGPRQLLWAEGGPIVFSLGRRRLDAPVCRAAGGRSGEPADARRIRSGGCGDRARRARRRIFVEPERYRPAPSLARPGRGRPTAGGHARRGN
jgi:dipeptidyl aminopeptidase/acylaminoacyl peptidase